MCDVVKNLLPVVGDDKSRYQNFFSEFAGLGMFAHFRDNADMLGRCPYIYYEKEKNIYTNTLKLEINQEAKRRGLFTTNNIFSILPFLNIQRNTA